MSELRIIFFTVQDASSKINTLIRIVQHHFMKQEKVHILVPDASTRSFVDQLLWSHPPESFLPHSAKTLDPFQDHIFISTELSDSAPFPILFNLSPLPIPSFTQTQKTLYEFEDLSHPQKTPSFKNKFITYKDLGYKICAGNLMDL